MKTNKMIDLSILYKCMYSLIGKCFSVLSQINDKILLIFPSFLVLLIHLLFVYVAPSLYGNTHGLCESIC